MEDAVKVAKGFESAKQMIEKLGNAFNELESRREASLPNNTQWADIKGYFGDIEKALHEKLSEVEEKERILEEKRSESSKLVAEREAAVAAKELASLDRLQELKDAAVSAISEARKNCKAPTPVLVDVKGNKDNKVSTSTIDGPNAPTPPEGNPPDNKSGDPAEAVAGEVKLRPQLMEVCEKMDAKGLLKILSDNKKLLTTIGEELSTAFKSAPEPARLVLDFLEGFYPQDPSNSQGGENNALQVLRRTCHVVLEAAAPLLVVAEQGNDHPVSSEIKQQAKAIADEWKAKLAGVDIDASNGYSLEAAAFLQLLITFSIAEEFHEDELCKLVLSISRRRQAPELCRSLGLIHRMPGVVETLVKTGRQIDAVHFAHAFQLTETFPPVPLLKEYLNNVTGNAQESTGDAAVVGGQKDVNKEIGALRVITKCIEEYKLHEEYPIEPLKTRMAQLEKAKYEKKRTAQPPKTQPKKPKSNGGYASRKPSAFIDNRQMPPPVYDERAMYPTITDRYSERYPYATQPAYDMASHAPYVQQPSTQRPYHYPDERVAPPAPYSSSSSYGTAGYGTTSYGSYTGSGYQSSTTSNYGNYIGTGVQSASPGYGSYTGAGGQQSHQPYM
ncbi:uncharacterized protein A4U43_C08F12440 [Asparagus officinalis]|uniref:FRIGIDA-like protein 3 n=1 Tax=Asparagus officinalis TaxID=4686 RepID=UPI00098E5D94|nr:FRIGIDA-like protein 3 [Asparagus officinalis]ONK59933.1 uncharacterized protein A4U43_C08F12440 [Asparagus officinalis]